MFPDHTTMDIRHNPHLANGRMLAMWLASQREISPISEPDCAEILRTGEVWMIQWMTSTSVMYHTSIASTIDRAAELARARKLP